MPVVNVLDSFMHYQESGRPDGTPVVFLHGNPTSSHLWRNVIPHVTSDARRLAPDLIGMGASGKPDIAFRFADHSRYLDAWFDALGLDEVVIVGHDWGGALGMNWARRNSDRIRGIAVAETFLRPIRWAEMPERAAELFRGFRSSDGEEMVLNQNMFIEVNLPLQIFTGLAPADHDVYRAPYPDPGSRKPLLAWAREFPLDGEPADVADIVNAYDKWMATTPDVPKLLMAVDGGATLGSPEMIDWARKTFVALEVESIGPGGHHIPEDQPGAIGRAVENWIHRHELTRAFR